MTTSDYYKILGINRNASSDVIRKAYRSLMFEYHPDKNLGALTEEKCKLITQAYSVLGDKNERRRYDDLGQKKRSDDNYSRTKFNYDTFNQQSVFDYDKQIPYSVDPPIIKKVIIPLKDVLYGGSKQLKYTKTNFLDGTAEERTIDMIINKGMSEGCKFMLPREGDVHPYRVPADIIFIFSFENANGLKREGVNLIYDISLSFSDFISGNLSGMVPTLDGENLAFKPNGRKEHVYKRYGLPYPDNPDNRGDLIIRFFPK